MGIYFDVLTQVVAHQFPDIHQVGSSFKYFVKHPAFIHGYGFIVLCPPNSCRSAATIHAADELDCKELNLAGNECVMTGFGKVHQPTWYP